MHAGDPGPARCVVRDFDIENPFYTYCANHPHRNPAKLTVPFGPVFVGDSFGHRRVWKLSPDTEEIRLKLLEMLNNIREEPTQDYPAGFYLDEVVILQLAEFREKRAIDDLKRITAFNVKPSPHPIFRDHVRTVAFAKQALEKIIA
jgi:hypothetical protein